MQNICKFGEQKNIGRGIFFICKKTGDHCINHSRWCSQTNKYVGVGDCSKCQYYVDEEEPKVEIKKTKNIETKKIEKSKEN